MVDLTADARQGSLIARGTRTQLTTSAMHIFKRPFSFTSLTLAIFLLHAIALHGHARKPNVVILFTDDQGTLDVGCYGSSDLYTPTMDKLAATGVRFTQAYAHTVCCPARAALLTGRHPQRSGVNSWTQGNMHGRDGINMALSEVTIAEALKPAGYRTALFGKWHVGSHREHGPTKQGFDTFFGIRNGFIDNYNHFFLHGMGYHDLYEGTKEVFARDKYFPDMITNRALKFIDANKEYPFLLYVGFNIPHYPEQALEQYTKRFAKLKQPRASYAAIVATTDHYMGQIVDKLESLGLRDDTIIIFMSDNGHSAETNHIRFDDHKSGLLKGHKYGALGGGGNTGKWRGNKGTFYEGGLRVPAIVSYPNRLPKGEVRDQAVTAMDWYPTILELAGIDRVSSDQPKVKLDGRSLLPLIKDKNAPSPHSVLYFQWMSRWAVRQGDWKLLGTNRNGKEPATTLVSLAGDEPEVANLTAAHPEEVARLKKLYDAWAADVFQKAGN